MNPVRTATGLLLCTLLAFSGTGCGKYGKPVRRSPDERAQIVPDAYQLSSAPAPAPAFASTWAGKESTR